MNAVLQLGGANAKHQRLPGLGMKPVIINVLVLLDRPANCRGQRDFLGVGRSVILCTLGNHRIADDHDLCDCAYSLRRGNSHIANSG